VDEQDDVGSGVGSADCDVVQAAGVADGDASGVVDAVVADAVVGVVAAAGAGQRRGQRVVDRGGGGPVWQESVGSALVVGVHEGVEQGLQLGEGGRLDGLGGQWRPTEGAGQRTDLD
jgi:hypothetical protein